MRRAAVVSLSVLALVAGVVVAPDAVADVPGPPYTAFGLTRAATPGGPGGAETFTGDQVLDRDITPTSVHVNADPDGLGDFENLDFAAPTGSTFTAGTAIDIAPTADSTHGSGSILALNRGCGQLTSGTVTVLEAVTADDGTVTAFAADLDVVCAAVRYVGFVRIASSIGYTGVTLDQPELDFPSIPLGGYQDLPVTLTAAGTNALPYISAETFGGDDPDAFSVVGDDCKDQSLAAGTSCTVTVRARPLVAGASVGTLVFVTDDGTPLEVGLSAAATDLAQGTYRAVTPVRAFDTRNGTGVRRGPVPAGGKLRASFAQFLPGQEAAVVLNLTVDRPTKPGYLTAFPTGTTRPTASSINFPAGWQGANLVTVPLGTADQIDIFNYLGDTSVIGDLVGYYAAGDGDRGNGGGYHPVAVQRLLDTRSPDYGQPIPGGYGVGIPVRYTGDQQDIAALSVTITAVRPKGAGYLTAWDNGPTIPHTSTLNFNSRSGVISNSAVVPVSYSAGNPCDDCAYIAVVNRSAQPTDVVVDINGFFDKGHLPAEVRYHPLTSPTRIVDSRSGLGTTPFGAAATRTITTPPTVADYDTVALDANITAVLPSQSTYVTVWPGYAGQDRPTTSVLNPNTRQTIANHAIAALNGTTFDLYNAFGVNNLLVDVSGTFELFPPTPADQVPHPPSGDVARPQVVTSASRNTAGVGPAVRRF